MNEKIKKLIKLVGQLNKLLLKVLELLGTITLIALSIKSIIELWGGITSSQGTTGIITQIKKECKI